MSDSVIGQCHPILKLLLVFHAISILHHTPAIDRSQGCQHAKWDGLTLLRLTEVVENVPPGEDRSM